MKASGRVPAADEKRRLYAEAHERVLRAVGGAEKAYDFPPHVVQVKSTYGTKAEIAVEGELGLMHSPWDPIASLLPVREDVWVVDHASLARSKWS